MPAYLPRATEALLRDALATAPVAVLTGARQAGKTTLLGHALAGWRMVSLEDLDVREFAVSDPRGFLAQYAPPLIIDEAQHVPALFSYIQTLVDGEGLPGRYVLSGSRQFSLMAGGTQSLAGRAALIDVHPLSVAELARAGALPDSLDRMMWMGGYPAPHARGDDPRRYYADYVRTYLERDVRSLTAVHDLGSFQRFLRLCAARTGQLLNVSSLAADAGIAHPTASAWLNVLEASFVIRRIAPNHRNFGKRLVKAPKLYFLDTGLAAWLLGITSESDLAHHYARGALFETLVVAEAIKWRAACGDARPVHFWRDNIGNEIDLVLEQDGGLTLVEIKSGRTFQPGWLDALRTVDRHMGHAARLALIYGGDADFERTAASVIGWRGLARAG